MKFKRLLILICLFTLTQQLFSQVADSAKCAILKKGKFLYLDADDKTAYIEMNGNYQIEKSKKTPYYIESSVEWVDSCTYIMTMTKITIPNFPFSPGDKMKVSITRIDADIIYYTSFVKDMSWNGRFKRIKE